jgi:hypothetical protein
MIKFLCELPVAPDRVHKAKLENVFIQSTPPKVIIAAVVKAQASSSRQPCPREHEHIVLRARRWRWVSSPSSWVGARWVRGSLGEHLIWGSVNTHHLHLTWKGRDSSRHDR